jgi:catechol 2,3-dioxygenase-like lactoylglutathione lyase family enzyme
MLIKEANMPVSFDLVGIAVKDMAASLKFYRLLGLPIPEGAESEDHVDLDLGGVRLAWDTVDLLKGVYDQWDEPSGHRIELAFKCDSPEEVNATYARISGAGYHGHKEPWDAFWGQRYAIVTDPDGNLLSLFA